MKLFIFLSVSSAMLIASPSYYEYDKQITLTKVTGEKNRSNKNIRYYKKDNGQIVGVKDEIIVKCINEKVCKNIFYKYNLKDVKNLSSTLYLIKVPESEDVFELSSKLYLEKDIEISHPNFVKKRYRR
jgi:hypothetical protein